MITFLEIMTFWTSIQIFGLLLVLRRRQLGVYLRSRQVASILQQLQGPGLLLQTRTLQTQLQQQQPLHHEADLDKVVNLSDCKNTSDRIIFTDTDGYHHNKFWSNNKVRDILYWQTISVTAISKHSNQWRYFSNYVSLEAKRWFQNYSKQSTVWLIEAHALMTELFKDSDCSFYRWESVDLTMSRVMSEISPGELR
jgi:hypothetical protein